MTSAGAVKICGLSGETTLATALEAGADMVGFVRYPRSSRHVGLETGRRLASLARGRARSVLLVVDPTDRELDEAVSAIEPDVVQLHGSETPERVASIRRLTGRPIMKAVAVANAADLARLDEYRDIAQMLLLDAKPDPGALPGGNGLPFDWAILADAEALQGFDRGRDLMLSGGLTAANVAEAIATTGIGAVDVSSGVETRPGTKDAAKIVAFVKAARAAFTKAGRTSIAPDRRVA